jgi:hypothetical protein
MVMIGTNTSQCTPTGVDPDTGDEEDDKKPKGIKRKRGSAPPSSTSTVSVDDIGSMVTTLKITETEDVLTIAGSKYSIPKMRAFFGKEMCWAHVATSKHGDEALKCCNHKGEPGHEADGELHTCTKQQREHIHFQIKDFRPSGNVRQ